MTESLRLVSRDGQIRALPIDAIPRSCPHCERYGTVEALFAVETAGKFRASRDAIAVFQCNDSFCGGAFVAAYAITMQNGKDFGGLLSHMPLKFSQLPKFSETIILLSPIFCKTYDEASQAEENGLSQIYGAGFRRSLEYLVKDYAIARIAPDDAVLKERIAKTLLGKCIQEHLPAGPVQEAAKRAAWLGNDETHYYRTWTDHDISDLKALIQLTVKWIDYTMEIDHYMTAMPSPRS